MRYEILIWKNKLTKNKTKSAAEIMILIHVTTLKAVLRLFLIDIMPISALAPSSGNAGKRLKIASEKLDTTKV